MEYRNDFGDFGVIVTQNSIMFTKGKGDDLKTMRVPSEFMNEFDEHEYLKIYNIYFDFTFRNPMQIKSHSKKIFETIAFIFNINLK